MEASKNIDQTRIEGKTTWLDKPLQSVVTLNWETILFFTIILLAVGSRFFDLGTRVMSHDETSHVYFSWLFDQGSGYSHDPVTHGPLQFHLVAFSYFLFGDSDFTARIPAALFSIATVALMWNYRRYLGRAGSIIAAILLLISPYLLYYGRYVRNEAFVAFFGVLTIWAILSYLETGKDRYLFWLAAGTALHFTTKETAFIYTAQALLFLVVYLVFRLFQSTWYHQEYRQRFIIAIIVAVILFAVAGGILFTSPAASVISATETAEPSVPGEETVGSGIRTPPVLPSILLVSGSLIAILALYFLIRGYTWNRLRSERAFSMLVILGTLTLPMLAPFPVKFLGYNPIDYQTTLNIIVTAGFVIFFSIMAIAIGLLWNPKLWLMNMVIFYAIFIILYTSIFTNGFGFYTGIVGSLGYWLEQQGVERGSQPWYYYWLIQVPFYEYLPALGSILAIIFAPRLLKPTSSENELTVNNLQETEPDTVEQLNDLRIISKKEMQGTTVALLSFWSITSLIAYTVAGEKMPWLTVHIAWPMILLSAWFIGKLVETTNWSNFRSQRGFLVVILLPIFFISTSAALGSLLGPNPPFQGKELAQLQSSTTFITSLLIAIASGWGISNIVKSWSAAQLIRIITLTLFVLLGLLTIRTSVRAAFIDYDNATEYLVYAHMARGPKEALAQIEEISRRTTDGLAIKVAYDDETTYPYWWYLRNYTNKDYFGANPTRSQRDAAAILVGEKNYGKIEPVVGQAYNQFDYIRIWWPNQDYFGLTPQRILDAIRNPQMRAALFDIWLNRDYTLYSQITEQDLSLPNWQPSQKFRLYIRKDVIGSMWNYGTGPAPEAIVADPYEGKQLDWNADNIIGDMGNEPGQFQRQRDLAVASDGTIYVADTENHRIQHLAEDGTVLHVWGGFGANTETETAAVGRFNEPWGIAVGPDDTIYVADTWNHRIQQFTPEGEFITTWGYGISQNDDPYGFYGPRDVAVNANGEVFVTDTGNKRIVIFDGNGQFISQFGEAGFGPGQFDEPVGIAIDSEGKVYVADTWNQRIQVFILGQDGSYSPLTNWDVVAWYGQTLDNKPYIDVDDSGNLYAADPEGYRILNFTTDGEFQFFWGDYSIGPDGFGLAGSVAVDPEGNIWVSDTGNNRLMHFTRDNTLVQPPVE